MTTAELRLGNYLMYGEKIVFVSSILKDNRIGIYDGMGFDKTVPLEACQPIKVTEKKLVMLGLEEGHIGYYHKNGVIVSCENHVYYGDEEVLVAETNFIHQLQNLFYSLTNDELTANFYNYY
jgi:hypothetical protein